MIMYKRWAVLPLTLLLSSALIGQRRAPLLKPSATARPSFEVAVKPVLAKNCYSCHNEKARVADLDLTPFTTPASIGKDLHVWEKVAEMVGTKQMPPKGLPRLSDAEIKAVTSWIEGEFERIESLAKPDPGRVTARRLNRTEYNNTVRDLLGVELRPGDDFPQDDSGYGFDNIGDVLSLSPVLMEKYLAAAEKVSHAALFGPDQVKPSGERFQPPGRPGALPKSAREYDETGLSLGSALHVRYKFPVDGEYVFRATCDGRRQGSGGVDMAFWLDGKLLGIQHIDVNDLEGQTREIRVPVTSGEHVVSATFYKVFERLPASFGGLNPMESTTPERRPAAAAKPQPERISAPGIRPPAGKVDFLYIGGPFNQAKGPSEESLKKIFACGHLKGGHSAVCSRKIVTNLASRAFRRPVTPQESDRFVQLMAGAQKRGNSFEQSVAVAIQAMLVSPQFLFRLEQDPETIRAGNYRISQQELASRLSYFLWASMPDQALLDEASRGTLRNPQVLSAQVRRMLKDPRAKSLVSDFGGQWLELRSLNEAKPEPRKFGAFDEHLRLSFRQETERLFEHIIGEDRPITDFLDAPYSFLNERLANFYGIAGVKGDEFQKVDLTGSRRAGVLTHASVLTVSSYANRTSPVLRGKWILDNLLNAPPPPPPPNVPALDDSATGQAASLRQQLERHRKDPACASCHSRMDPLGLALENFDAIGAWREEDGKFPIDAAGELPDGRSFKGSEDLLALLAKERDAFTRGMTEKMLTYALGRGLERSDRRTVREIARKVAADNYRFSTLVLEIAKSLPFQMRRVEPKS